MLLVGISKNRDENGEFSANPECRESLHSSVEYYNTVGYNPPWICYYAVVFGKPVGTAAFKGAPVNNKVEIAYGTFENYRNKGIGTQICGKLVEIALKFEPGLIITARTLPEFNHSTRILERNNFILKGSISDPDDGVVWEWVLKK